MEFFPRARRPQNFARKDSLAAFKTRLNRVPSPHRPLNRKPGPWTALIPKWLRKVKSWVTNLFHMKSSEEPPMMSDASSGLESHDRYDEDAWEDVTIWENTGLWDSVDANILELGLH
jgi:hypothetical protein